MRVKRGLAPFVGTRNIWIWLKASAEAAAVCIRTAREAVERSLAYAFVGRKLVPSANSASCGSAHQRWRPRKRPVLFQADVWLGSGWRGSEP